jgi:Flp pilus assembly pilin Flp
MRLEFRKCSNLLRRLASQESGQDLVEYALIMGLMALAITASTHSMAVVLTTALTNINTYFASLT